MNESELIKDVDEYVESNWDCVVADIARLVSIPSVEEKSAAQEGAPFGPGPRKALTEALSIAAGMGFETCDLDGYIGYAQMNAGAAKPEGAKQLGIIGHVDVVPAGPGWTVDPFSVTKRDGYLIGRGVIDDKGPIMVALHACKFWMDRGAAFPHDIRVLFGANEETGMGDLAYYQQKFADPDFLFTPDAEFPVSYGEKGLFNGWFTKELTQDGAIASLNGGMAFNAVPGEACADVRAAEAPSNFGMEGITVSEATEPGVFHVLAQGRSAHASTPEKGSSALGLLARWLLETGLCSQEEQAFLQLMVDLADAPDGSSLGLACQDEHFGGLTAAGGMARLENGVLCQSIDCRWPTSTTAEAMVAALEERASAAGARFELVSSEAPFLLQPDSDVVQSLLSVYNEVTGENAEPFTMGGATYARHFTKAVSFGVEKPWVEMPSWAGSMHGPDEAVGEDQLKQAMKIYILAIGRLMETDL